MGPVRRALYKWRDEEPPNEELVRLNCQGKGEHRKGKKNPGELRIGGDADSGDVPEYQPYRPHECPAHARQHALCDGQRRKYHRACFDPHLIAAARMRLFQMADKKAPSQVTRDPHVRQAPAGRVLQAAARESLRAATVAAPRRDDEPLR